MSREGNGTPLQYSCLENPIDWGAWKAAVHGVTKGRSRLSNFTFTFHFHALEKEMATHSSVLTWRIPGMAEPGGLPSMGSHRVGHDWSDLATAEVTRWLVGAMNGIVQFISVTQSCPTFCDPMNGSMPGLPVHHQLPESTQTHVHWVSDAIQPSHLCCPFLLLSSTFPSIRVFSNESALCIRWPKYWSFSLNISSSNEHPGLIFLRMDWLDLLAVQGSLKRMG